MTTTRRVILSRLAAGAAATALQPLLAGPARAQDGAAALLAQLEDDLERHASFGPKFSGGPGDNATADWIAGRLERAGYAVSESTFEAPFFIERAATLTSGDRRTDVVPQAPVVPTGPVGLSARLAFVDGNENTVGDVRGRIAFIVAPFGRHAALFPNRGIGQTVFAAADAGAAGIVLVTTGPSGEAIALNAPEEPFVPVPMAVMAPKISEPFVAAARAGDEATLVLDGEATHRPSKNIVARLERGPKWIAISTPRSGWYDCVAERGTGTAVFLELADWAAARFPGVSIFLMNTGGHEYFFAGSHRVIDQAPPSSDILVWAHIGATLAARDSEERDGRLVMLDRADPGRSLMATQVARSAAAQGFRGLSGLTEPQPVRTNAGELSTFTDRGVAAAFAVLGLHPWFHTTGDTLERVDAKLLLPVLQAHERTIELLVDWGNG